MPDPTPKLGIPRPLDNELVKRQAFVDIYDQIDSAAAAEDDLDAHTASAFGHSGITGFAAPAITLDTTASAGTGTSVIRHNATIAAFEADNPITQAIGDAPSTGTSAKAARRDHRHGMFSTVALGSQVSGQLPLANGGTGAALAAANGGIVYSGPSALAILAPGSAGQIIRSAGAGAPVWSTATYPATAGASGNVLKSDGTNFVSAQLAHDNLSGITEDQHHARGHNHSAAADGTALAPSSVTVSGRVVVGTSGADAPGRLVNTEFGTAGTNSVIAVTHADNTNGGSGAVVYAKVAGSSAGDAFTLYQVTGGEQWATGIDNSDADAFVLSQGAAPGSTNRLRIDTGGVITAPGVLVAGHAARLGSDTTFEAHGTSTANERGVYIGQWGASTSAAQLMLRKSRNATVGSHGAVAGGDVIASISAEGSDGSAFAPGARIRAIADAGWSASVRDTKLVFETATGAGTPAERLRIEPGGAIVAASTVDAGTGYRVNGGAASGNYLRGNGTNFVSSAIQAADLPSHTHTAHTDRTRIAAASYIGGAVASTGLSLNAIDFADGSTITAGWHLVIPKDYTGGATLHVTYKGTTNPGSNNGVMLRRDVRLHPVAGGASSTLVTAQSTITIPATGTHVTDITLETFSAAAGDVLDISITRVGGDAADTYTGTYRVLSVYLTYTADM